jgi:periplasmic copper chaperone A
MKIPVQLSILLGLCLTLAAGATAQVQLPDVQLPKVEGAWVRSSVSGQQGTGAFMKLTAKVPMQLVGVSTPVAGSAEVHQMKMEGDLMTMRPVSRLDLPAGRTVEFKPGGYHLMLMDLKSPLKQGDKLPVTLEFEKAGKVKLAFDVQAVGAKGPGADEGHSGGHDSHSGAKK